MNEQTNEERTNKRTHEWINELMNEGPTAKVGVSVFVFLSNFSLEHRRAKSDLSFISERGKTGEVLKHLRHVHNEGGNRWPRRQTTQGTGRLFNSKTLHK